VINPWTFLPTNGFAKRVIGKSIYEVGAAWLEPYVKWRLTKSVRGGYFDVIWNNQCEIFGPATASMIRRSATWMMTYVNDDPFGTRDKERFSLFKKSLEHYDLTVVVRRPNIAEAQAFGARRVLLVRMSADEVAHRPLTLAPEEKARWANQVVFIGTWMPERGPFLLRLIELGVPLTIFGNRWHKAREWPFLKKFWRPPILQSDYVKAVQCAQICLGLVSKGNRDLHTFRSTEIPYIGSVLCAERTCDHLAMYTEDKEAVFWSTPEECADECFRLIENPGKRDLIAQAGRQRCIRSGYLNESALETILTTLLEK
jgi:hypothetical protein